MPRSRTRKNKPPSRPRLTHTGRVSDHAEPAPPATRTEAPHLSWPTAAVRDFYLAGERENSLADGNSLDGLAGFAQELPQGPVVRRDRADLRVLVGPVLPVAPHAERHRGDAQRAVEAPVPGSVLAQEIGLEALGQ